MSSLFEVKGQPVSETTWVPLPRWPLVFTTFRQVGHFLAERTQSSERLSNLLRVTQLINDRAGKWIQVLWFSFQTKVRALSLLSGSAFSHAWIQRVRGQACFCVSWWRYLGTIVALTFKVSISLSLCPWPRVPFGGVTHLRTTADGCNRTSAFGEKFPWCVHLAMSFREIIHKSSLSYPIM